MLTPQKCTDKSTKTQVSTGCRHLVLHINHKFSRLHLQFIFFINFCVIHFLGSVQFHIGALDPVTPSSLVSVQGRRDRLMLLPHFHPSVAPTKAFDCQNPDSSPLLFKYCSFLFSLKRTRNIFLSSIVGLPSCNR